MDGIRKYVNRSINDELNDEIKQVIKHHVKGQGAFDINIEHSESEYDAIDLIVRKNPIKYYWSEKTCNSLKELCEEIITEFNREKGWSSRLDRYENDQDGAIKWLFTSDWDIYLSTTTGTHL